MPLPPTTPLPNKVGIWAWAHKWLIVAALAFSGFGLWQGVRLYLGVGVVVDVVQRGDLIETVVASGHVETPFRAEIGSQITGTVADVLVEEGMSVKSGQPLIALEARELNSSLEQAQGVVAQAEARMRQLQELTLPSAKQSLAQAKATLVNAQLSFDRTSELSLKGFATRAALDDARKALDIATTQVRTAELEVYTASLGGSDYVMAQTQLNQARASLDTASSRLAYATIRAPRDGVLISRAVERGAVVQPGKTLLILTPIGDTQLILQIDERNLGLIKLAQKAIASADAYPDHKFEAAVSYINPGVDITRAAVEVKLDVIKPPDYLRQDMTVSVDIEVARKSATLVLPSRSVREVLSGKPWVMGLREGRAYRQTVKLGLIGATKTEILEGLGEGASAVPSASGVLSGQRIRPVAP